MQHEVIPRSNSVINIMHLVDQFFFPLLVLNELGKNVCGTLPLPAFQEPGTPQRMVMTLADALVDCLSGSLGRLNRQNMACLYISFAISHRFAN